jgi:hypothetical protein
MINIVYRVHTSLILALYVGDQLPTKHWFFAVYVIASGVPSASGQRAELFPGCPTLHCNGRIFR